MTNEALKTPVDTLELSVRSSEWIATLRANTLGELLAQPRLELPADWPPAMARRVASELQTLFEEMGVEYHGELVVPLLAEASLQATGDVRSRWDTIRCWLEQEHPDVLDQFNSPASGEAIAAAEAKLGVTLPDDYKAFLRLADGQNEFAAFVGQGALLPIAEVAETQLMGEEVDVPIECVGEGVRAVDCARGWIPISRSSRGRDFLCIDLDPAPNGTWGQIIEYVVDAGARPLVANTFADLLSLYFVQAQTGEIELE